MTSVIAIFHFLLFFALLPPGPAPHPLTAWKKKIWKNGKKNHLEISSFYTSVPKIMITCYNVPEIQHVTGAIVIFHFGIFFSLLPPNSTKNENFKTKRKKALGDTILNMCIKNHDHIQYCSWEVARDKCNYSSFWAIFYSFTPLTAQKRKFEKMEKKNHLEISSFYTGVPKIMITCNNVPEIWRVTSTIVIFHFGIFFSLSPP